MGTSIPTVIVQFQAQGVPQVLGSFQKLTTESGRFTAITRQSFTAVNATGFAISQLASGGQVGFRSLAASATGFLSFFGGTGLIAAAVVSTGLVLTDFWTRQRKEIDATAKAATDKLLAGAVARTARDFPVLLAEQGLAAEQAKLAANQRAMEEVTRKHTIRGGGLSMAGVSRMAPLEAERLKLLTAEREAFRALVEARAKSNETTKETAKATNAAKDALDAEISALVQLGRAGQLSVADLTRLTDLQEQFTKAVRDGTLSLEQRAQASRRLMQAESGITIPPFSVIGITETTTTRAPAPASRITLTPADQAKLAGTTAPVATAVSTSFATAFQAGLMSGVQGFVTGGGIENAYNVLGSALVSGLTTLNPWLGVVGSVITGTLSSIAGGGRDRRPRAAELPIDIRRVITDPNFRQPVQARPTSQFSGRPLVITSGEGVRVLTTTVGRGRGRGIG